MQVRLCINDGIIGGDKARDICNVFGQTLFFCFEQRKQYYEYYYRKEIDLNITLKDIQQLMDLNYTIKMNNNIMEIK